MDDTHMSRNFGPISDSMSLITRKTKNEEEDWPTEGHGYVCFNPDWQAGRSSQFILYSLELDRTAVEKSFVFLILFFYYRNVLLVLIYNKKN